MQTDLRTLRSRVVISDAMQPAPSPDGMWLAFVALDISRSNPPEVARSIRILRLADGEVRTVVPVDRFYDVYAPRWLDNDTLLFTASENPPTSSRAGPHMVLDALLGLRLAHAHGWSGEVWRINRDGTDLRKLTQLNLQAPIVAPAPDGDAFAVYALNGLWVFDAAGDNPRQLSEDGGSGGIVWTR
jgi:hypothetical protein